MLYNTSCSQDLMAANLISNTGEGIVIKRNAANNLVRTLLYTFYCTRIFSIRTRVEIFLQAKTCSKLLTFMLRSQTLTSIPPLV